MARAKVSYFETYRFRKITALLLSVSALVMILWMALWLRIFLNYRTAELNFWNQQKSNAESQQQIFFALTTTIFVLLTLICAASLRITYCFVKGTHNGYITFRIITWLLIIIIIAAIILISFLPHNEVKKVSDALTGQKKLVTLARPNYLSGWLMLSAAVVFAVLCGIARRTFGYIQADRTLKRKITEPKSVRNA